MRLLEGGGGGERRNVSNFVRGWLIDIRANSLCKKNSNYKHGGSANLVFYLTNATQWGSAHGLSDV